MIECGEQLVNGCRTKGVANFRSVKCNAHGAMRLGTVVGDVVKRKTLHFVPLCWVKNVRYVLCAHVLSVSPATSVFARCALGIA